MDQGAQGSVHDVGYWPGEKGHDIFSVSVDRTFRYPHTCGSEEGSCSSLIDFRTTQLSA